VRPDVELVGVQVEACAPFRPHCRPVSRWRRQRPHDRGWHRRQESRQTHAQLIDDWVDQILLVTEDEVAEAMVFLLERSKLVVEGAGAVGVAALLSGKLSGPTRERLC